MLADDGLFDEWERQEHEKREKEIADFALALEFVDYISDWLDNGPDCNA